MIGRYSTTLRESRSAFSLARRVLDGLLVACAFLFTATYVTVALARLFYPFQLEWMEGVMVDHVRRLLAGQALYVKPSLEFVSLLYPPLYYVVGAGFSKILGLGFPALRMASFLASLGVFALLVAIVRRETRRTFFGLLAAGLLAATYEKTGAWFDLGRLDSCYLLLLLASVLALRRARSNAGAIGAGLLMTAAFLTKQSALVIAVPLAVGALLGHVRRGCVFVAATAVGIGTGVLLLDRATSGWFTYYCFTLPAHHPSVPGAWVAFWTVDVLPALGPACLVSLVAVASRVRRRGDSWRFYYPLVAAGMIGNSWSVRTMVGAELNNAFPAFAALAILVAIGLHDVWQWASRADRPRAAVAAMLVDALLVVQFAMLVYDPRVALPKPGDRAAGLRVATRLAAVPGDVFAPHDGYLARLSGKRAFAHALAIDNVFLDDTGPARRDLLREIVTAISERRFAAVVIESDGWHHAVIRAHYPDCRRLVDRPDAFYPVSGARLRPEFLCRP